MRLAVIIVVLLFAACTTTKSLTGYYIPVNSMSPNGLRLELNANGAFEMIGWSDIMGSDTAVGTWSVKGNKLFLTKPQSGAETLPKPDSVVSVVEGIDKSEPNIKIRVIDATDSLPFVGVGLDINADPKHYFTDESGFVSVSKDSILKSIYLSYLSIQRNIKIPPPRANDILIKINFKKLPKLHWLSVPKAWVVKRGKIIPLGDNDTLRVHAALKKVRASYNARRAVL